jgi:hypothetical protein
MPDLLTTPQRFPLMGGPPNIAATISNQIEAAPVFVTSRG